MKGKRKIEKRLKILEQHLNELRIKIVRCNRKEYKVGLLDQGWNMTCFYKILATIYGLFVGTMDLYIDKGGVVGWRDIYF